MFQNVERRLTDFVAKFAPWLSPLPTAYLTGRATIEHLEWPAALGVVAGVIIECLGLAAVNTALELYNYNRDKRKSDPAAPLFIALVLVGVYFVSVTVLTVFLDTLPGMAAGAPLVFPVLSLAGVTTLALRADHGRRVGVIEAERAERSAKRSGDRSGVRSVTGQVNGHDRPMAADGGANVTGQDGNLTAVNRSRRANRDQAIEELMAFLSSNPGASYREAGESVGRSKTWAIGAIGDLEQAGRLTKNGNGWEISN